MTKVQLLIAHALIAVATTATIPACTINVQSPAEEPDTDSTSETEVAHSIDRHSTTTGDVASEPETAGDDTSSGADTGDSTSTSGSTTDAGQEPADDSTGADTETSTTGSDDSATTGETADSSTTGAEDPEPCGNGVPDAGEDCDGSAPYGGVGCSEDCRFDFSSVPQMFCAGTCSWAGGSNCDQADADLFCQLRTGKPDATATSFELGAPTDAAGFPCSNPDITIEVDGEDPRVLIGKLPGFGVSIDVYYQAAKVAESHGTGASAAIVSITCS